MSKKVFVFLIMALVIVGFAFSDADKTGIISGIVKNPQGEPLAGVIVLLRSPALILPEIEAVTDTLGMYRFPFLSPGSYELMFILHGFQQVTRSGIEVTSGREVMQDIVYSLRAPNESLVVEGSPPDEKYKGLEYALFKRSRGRWQFHISSLIGFQPKHDTDRILDTPDLYQRSEGQPFAIGSEQTELPQWNKVSKIRLILYRLGFFTLGPKPHSNHPNIPL
jgi:hypothetical protein